MTTTGVNEEHYYVAYDSFGREYHSEIEGDALAAARHSRRRKLEALHEQAKEDQRYIDARLAEGALFAKLPSSNVIHEVTCQFVIRYLDRESVLRETIAYCDEQCGGDYRYVRTPLPTLLTRREIEKSGTRRRRCEICAPNITVWSPPPKNTEYRTIRASSLRDRHIGMTLIGADGESLGVIRGVSLVIHTTDTTKHVLPNDTVTVHVQQKETTGENK